ncbi:MAG: NAD(P)H-hydrate dehydratase [Pyrinomonadaceae bacterium]
MREIDRLTTERYATPSLLLMEAAAEASARVIVEKCNGDIKGKSVLILCGKGNNGGDGATLARKLALQGADVRIILFGHVEETKGDARVNFEIAKSLANTQRIVQDHPNDIFTHRLFSNSTAFVTLEELETADEWREFDNPDIHFDVIVDALFGTGLSRSLGEPYETVIGHINIEHEFRGTELEDQTLIVSLDIPSGLNADLSDPIGAHIEADLTITFTAPKLANLLPPASRANGELVIADIGSPQILIDESPSKLFLIEESDARNWLVKTRYAAGSYKGTHGHALVVAGSREMTGAAVLSSDAAMRAGAGLVTVATANSALPSVAARVMPEVMTAALAETADGAIAFEALEKFDELMTRANVVAMGCGMTSKDDSTKHFVRAVVEKRTKPLVLDADALNALAPFPDDLHGTKNAPLILTPHIGEFRRLLGVDDKAKFDDRVAVAREFATKHELILVLKGERTLIAAPDGRVFINPTGNAGLGTAGAGDTLTGLIVGFLAQTFGLLAQNSHAENSNDAHSTNDMQHDFTEAALEAVIAALYVGGQAGDIAAREKGMRTMTASDIRENFSVAICALDPRGEMPSQSKAEG